MFVVVEFNMLFHLLTDIWYLVSLHGDYFVEGRGEVKGDVQSNVAIRVDSGPIQGGAVVVPWRRAAMCGDPPGTITNGCRRRRGGVKGSLSSRGGPILSSAVYAGVSDLMMRGDRDCDEPSRPGLIC